MIKKFNAIPEKKRIIRQKNVDRLKYIYSIMTQEQRAKSEAFPKLVPSPPPAPKVKKGETSDIPPPPPPIQQ